MVINPTIPTKQTITSDLNSNTKLKKDHSIHF